MSKFECCPHCGRCIFVRPAKKDGLSAQEAVEPARAHTIGYVPTPGEEERLRRELSDSRYENS